MKISSSVLLAQAVQAAPQGERAFVDSSSFLAVGTEGWWSNAVANGWDPEVYIQNTENGIPAMVAAFRDAADDPKQDGGQALRIRRIADRFESQMERILKNMRKG